MAKGKVKEEFTRQRGSEEIQEDINIRSGLINRLVTTSKTRCLPIFETTPRASAKGEIS
jgi:hypothetical protein